MAKWHWVLHDRDGKDLRSSSGFDSKEDAETWMSLNWSRLRDEGAESVTLTQDGTPSYEMGLGEG